MIPWLDLFISALGECMGWLQGLMLALWLGLSASSAQAEEATLGDLALAPIKGLADIPDFLRQADPRDHAATYAWLTAVTAAMIAVDQPVIDESQRFAWRLGLINEDDDGRKTKVVSHNRIFGIGADFHLPLSPNTFMYYLGDGLTSLLITGGLVSYSLLSNDNKALLTASQLVEALVLNGSVILTLKVATGRESPFRATQPGGRWRGYVGIRNYLGDVSAHDAYPSGHIATAMTTVRILAENYGDRTWINPLGYTAMGLLMFAMLNNGVHWLSDFPLGIAVGYHAAGVVMARHHIVTSATASVFANVVPIISEGRLGFAKTWWF